MKHFLFPLIVLPLLLGACSSEDDEQEQVSLIQDAERDEKCKGTACTSEHAIAIVHVVDAEGAPVSIADRDFKVYYTESKAAITFDRETLSIEADEIAIATDTYISHIAFDGISITVEVDTDGYESIQQEYVVSRDCCHVLNPEGQRLYLVLP